MQPIVVFGRGVDVETLEEVAAVELGGAAQRFDVSGLGEIGETFDVDVDAGVLDSNQGDALPIHRKPWRQLGGNSLQHAAQTRSRRFLVAAPEEPRQLAARLAPA